jgi:signal transduction histidine kinase
LTIVRTSGNHLRALIDDILALSALESGQFRLSREELDVAQVATDVVTESVLAADQKGIYLELTELSPRPIVAFVDRRRLRQIIQNVVSNAVKFTTRGGVVVTLGREGEDIVVSVSDTGPGIKKEALENIFNEFSQAGDSSSERQGTGLGLAITRRLAQMHGGSVKVDSTLGQGSTFTIRIPADARRSERPSMVEPLSEPVIRDA